jgi:hypothetical protein
MNKLIVAVGLTASLLLSSAADAQRHQSRDSGWSWNRHNAGTFRNRGQCQKALVAERNMARRDATRHRVNSGMFNQRWRLRCIASRQRGRLVYRIG